MPISQSKIRAAISDGDRPLSERLILEWKWRDVLIIGPFRIALWNAIESADDSELEKLARGFSDEVTAVRLFRSTWIGKSLADEGLLEFPPLALPH